MNMARLAQNPMTFFMLAVFVTMLYVASGYPEGARFMPFVVGIPALLLCLIQLVLDLREPLGKVRDDRSEMEKAEEKVAQMTGRQVEFDAAHMEPGLAISGNPTGVARNREFIIWGFILAFVASILLFGYYVAVPLFILLYLRTQAEYTWGKALRFTLIGCGVILGALTWGLKLQLHDGFITSALLSLF